MPDLKRRLWERPPLSRSCTSLLGSVRCGRVIVHGPTSPSRAKNVSELQIAVIQWVVPDSVKTAVMRAVLPMETCSSDSLTSLTDPSTTKSFVRQRVPTWVRNWRVTRRTTMLGPIEGYEDVNALQRHQTNVQDKAPCVPPVCW